MVVWMCGVITIKSGSDVAVGCLADRKHCFGVLVIFDCCLVMMEP